MRPAATLSRIAGRLLMVGLLSLSAHAVRLHADEQAKKPDPPKKPAQQLKPLFDGKTLGKWKAVDKYDFKRHGKVHVKDGRLILEEGQPATGIRWTGKFPKDDYELTLEAMRLSGTDFFCGLTFPVEESALTLILGGWGGYLVGLSCVDGFYAADNETAQQLDFKDNQWYHVRVRVADDKVLVWIDDEEYVDFETTDRKLTVSWEMEPCQPLGVASWYTGGAVRNFRYRVLSEGE